MKPQHTKGPWKYRWSISNRFAYSLHGENDYTIMGVSNQDGLIPSESDARLIASAPEMLQALKELVDRFPNPLPSFMQNQAISHAREVIAKAEGS